MTLWLSVIGIGDGGLDTLSPEARRRLDAARIVFGGARHLAMLEEGAQERRPWRSPFADSLAEIEALRGSAVAVLASGDPMWFGVGATLARRFAPSEMRVLPAPSAFSLAAARLGWALQEVETSSVHSRPLAAALRILRPGARLLVLSEDGTTPARLAELLTAQGYGPSRMTVLEHLGGEKERLREAVASGFDLSAVADLNLVAVECRLAPASRFYPRIGGLPDEAFRHDGKMTKRVLRALALAALEPCPGELLWDVGAGCGSVSVEWMRAGSAMRAVAIEPLASRREMIAQNAEALGAPEIRIVAGAAPEALAGLPTPDAVFIGGGLTDGVFEPAWGALRPGGRLAAHAVTLESDVILLDLHRRFGGELSRISVERAQDVGSFRGWKPAMPVLHWHIVKPRDGTGADAASFMREKA